jgi:hypothetical protein
MKKKCHVDVPFIHGVVFVGAAGSLSPAVSVTHDEKKNEKRKKST